MRTWVIIPGIRPRSWPDDMLCCELEDGRLLWIHHDGLSDIEPADTGLPNPEMFDLFE